MRLILVLEFLSFFFFSSRRRHTRFDCDWSSDVCSSDLELALEPVLGALVLARLLPQVRVAPVQIGRASCRERVEISVVAVSLKKKKQLRKSKRDRKSNRRPTKGAVITERESC